MAGVQMISVLAVLRRLRALRELDLIDPSELVDWASEQLADYPSLLPLAVLPRHVSSEEVGHAADRILQEAGEPPMSPDRAGRLLALEVVGEISDGLLGPIEGARQLWALARRAPGTEPVLRPFIGLASEWEDAPEFQSDYEADIIAEARSLLASRVPDE